MIRLFSCAKQDAFEINEVQLKDKRISVELNQVGHKAQFMAHRSRKVEGN